MVLQKLFINIFLFFLDKLNSKQHYCIMQVTQQRKEIIKDYIFYNERPIYIQLVEWKIQHLIITKNLTYQKKLK